MPNSPSAWFNIMTIAIYLLILFVPGLLVSFAAGLRGWILAGIAPLITYSVAGVVGPWFSLAGISYNTWTLLFATLFFTGLAAGARFLMLRRQKAQPDKLNSEATATDRAWALRGNIAVAVCLVFAALVGGYAMLGANGILDGISQGFDPAYHANGIRYIAETGDSGLTATGQPNWYEPGQGLFYPNAYHLIGAVTFKLSGASIPAVLNTITAASPGLLALGIVAVVRQFRGRAVLASACAFTLVAAVTMTFELAVMGPVLPFLLGVCLTPMAALVVRRFLTRPGLDTGLICGLGASGLLAIHSSTLFGGFLFTVPMLIQRWLTESANSRIKSRLRLLGSDLLRLLMVAIPSAILVAPQLLGALNVATGKLEYEGWPSSSTEVPRWFGTLFTFQYVEAHPQVWLCLGLLIGISQFKTLAQLRWLGAAAIPWGALFIAVSTSDSHWVMALARPWWDDSARILALATIPLCVLAAHGIAETQRWGTNFLCKPIGRLKWNLSWTKSAIATVSAVAVLGGFVAVTDGLYYKTNGAKLAGVNATGPGSRNGEMTVSPSEAEAMLELGKLAKPGEWAMNDHADGTVWTYALSGVRTVAGHWTKDFLPPDSQLLDQRFNQYQTDAEVRAACARLNIHWVIVTKGLFPGYDRAKGLENIEGLPFLEPVYRNDQAVIYRLKPA